MKKLMIAAAIVCAAAMSQAAQIPWGFGGNVWLTEDGTTAKAAWDGSKLITSPVVPSGSQLVLLYLGTSYTKDIDLTKIGAEGGYTIVDTMDYGIITGGAPGNRGKWSPMSSTTPELSYADNATFGIVFYDGTDYDYVYGVNTANGNVGDALVKGFTVADMSEGASVNTLYATGSSSTAGAINVGAVPEPTSGLLLLLGVAGLALRRRRA